MSSPAGTIIPTTWIFVAAAAAAAAAATCFIRGGDGGRGWEKGERDSPENRSDVTWLKGSQSLAAYGMPCSQCVQ